MTPSVKQTSDPKIAQLLKSLHLPKLSDNHLEVLNAPFTVNDIFQIISTLSNGNAPGPDGFSVLQIIFPNTSSLQTFNAAMS